MKSRHQSLVHRAVALQIEVEPRAIGDHQCLGSDLGLDRFDLLMIGLRLAGWVDGRGEFPAFEMSMAMTVGDLVALLRRWERGPDDCRQHDGDDDEEDEDDEAPPSIRTSHPPPLEQRDSYG